MKLLKYLAIIYPLVLITGCNSGSDTNLTSVSLKPPKEKNLKPFSH